MISYIGAKREYIVLAKPGLYFIVRGQSMEPLCKEGDFVLLDKMSYLVFRPRSGDVVVLRHPQEDRLILKYITKEKVEGRHSFYWVEGLNKEESSDSRSFGWIPQEMILGRVLLINKPRTRAKLGAGLRSA